MSAIHNTTQERVTLCIGQMFLYLREVCCWPESDAGPLYGAACDKAISVFVKITGGVCVTHTHTHREEKCLLWEVCVMQLVTDGQTELWEHFAPGVWYETHIISSFSQTGLNIHLLYPCAQTLPQASDSLISSCSSLTKLYCT